MRYPRLIVVTLSVFTFMVACTTTELSRADEAVIRYYEALANQTESTSPIGELVCSDYEMQAQIDFDSFGAVDTSLNDIDCTTTEETSDTATVLCSGTISVTYDGESNELMNLDDFSFVATKEDEQWRMCGYE